MDIFLQKSRARFALTNAIISGKLKRPDACEWCHVECVPQGHHYDYSLPTSVVWLCRRCHIAEHKLIRQYSAHTSAQG